MWKPELRPSRRIRRVLMGEVPLEQEDPAIQSVCSFYIFEGAKEILALPDKAKRQKALSRVPALIRPHVEKEVWRIFDQRRGR